MAKRVHCDKHQQAKGLPVFRTCLSKFRQFDGQTTEDDSLPILKRLQAQKEHIEKLRGELRSLSFTDKDEVATSVATGVNKQCSSVSCNTTPISNVSLKVGLLDTPHNTSSTFM